MSQVRSYDVHGLLSLSVSTRSSMLKRYLDNIHGQLHGFRSSKQSHARLSIVVGPFEPDLEGTELLDDSFWVKDGYLFTRGERKFASWRLEVTLTDEDIVCRVDTNLAGAVTKPHFFAEFLIQYALARHGASVIHAAALEKDGQVILLPGSSGGGKTTICMTLMDSGFSFLGDNYTIIYRGRAYSYPSPLNVFSYNLVPQIRMSLGRRGLLDLRLRLLLYQLSGGYLKIFKKVDPAAVVPRMSDSGEIRTVCFLTPSNRNKVDVRAMPRELALRRLDKNMQLEWHDFAESLDSYSYAGGSEFSSFWDNALKLLDTNVAPKVTFNEIVVPERYDSNSRAEVASIVRGIFHGGGPDEAR